MVFDPTKVMDLETIFHFRASLPPGEDPFWLRIKRIWTGNRVYNSSSYYSMVSFRIKTSKAFSHFQVNGEIKLHSLSPEIKSTFNEMWYPGKNCWNIENSSILLSLKTGFVKLRLVIMVPMRYSLCFNLHVQSETNMKNLKLKIAENQQLEKNALAFCLCEKQLLFQEGINEPSSFTST